MTATRMFQSALGISTGDIVRTEFGPDRMYSSGPYEVWAIRGPVYVTVGPFYVANDWNTLVVRDYPVISLTCINPGYNQPDMYSLSWYRQEGDRYLDDRNGELFLVERGLHQGQMGLFSAVADLPEPYAFDPNVDYAGELPTWKCRSCYRDFTADYRRQAPGHHLTYPPACIHCGKYGARQICVLRRVEVTS